MTYPRFIKHTIRNIIKSRPIRAILSRLIYLYARFVWKSTQWQFEHLDRLTDTWKKEKSIILIGWHNRVPMMPLLMDFAQGKMKALVSLHQDGQIIAKFLNMFNIETINGSSTVNAKGAAVGIMHTLKKDISVTIIPDGPKGPRMKMGMSPIYFASKSGKPIIVMTYSQKGAKIINKAWDKMLVPVPFSKGIYSFSKPVYVPQEADDETLEKYRQELEKIANNLTWDADKKMGQPHIKPQTHARRKRY